MSRELLRRVGKSGAQLSRLVHRFESRRSAIRSSSHLSACRTDFVRKMASEFAYGQSLTAEGARGRGHDVLYATELKLG